MNPNHLEPIVSTAQYAIRTFHLEHALAATLYLDRALNLDARRLSLVLCTWGHRALVSPSDQRLMDLLGWDAERLEDARLTLALESPSWTVGRDSDTDLPFYRLAYGRWADACFPSTWDISSRAMADYTRLYTVRAGLKVAARYCALGSEEALTLAALSVSIDFADRERFGEWSSWHAEVLAGIDVGAAVKALEAAGYLEVETPGRFRFTPSYAENLTSIHSLQSTAARKQGLEFAFERKWVEKHRRKGLAGARLRKELAEAENRLSTYYLYALRLPKNCGDLGIEVGGTSIKAGDIVYVGMTRVPSRRRHEHASVRGSENNVLFREIKDLLEMTMDPSTGEPLAFEFEIIETLPNSNRVLAAIREREAVRSAAALGHPLVNRQYLEPGLDFISAA